MANTPPAGMAVRPLALRSDQPGAVIFEFFPLNYTYVSQNFGQAAYEAAFASISAALHGYLEGKYIADLIYSGSLRISFLCRPRSGVPLSEELCAHVIGAACDAVALEVQGGASRLFQVRLAGRWSLPGEGREGSRATRSSRAPVDATSMAESDVAMCRRPHADRTAGLERKPAVRVAWRPVVAADGDDVLYYQSLARFDTQPTVTGDRLDGRRGYEAAIDEHLVTTAIDELERQSGIVLSAPVTSIVSAESCWWNDVSERLRARPDCATRLVLEFGEGAPAADDAALLRFCALVRECGCRIAIGEFGNGFSSVRQLVAIAPDIVKLDRGFVRRAASCARNREILAGLTHLARAVGATVVADGVDTPAQARLAEELGLRWQLGHLWGEGSSYRPWKGLSARGKPSFESSQAFSLAG